MMQQLAHKNLKIGGLVAESYSMGRLPATPLWSDLRAARRTPLHTQTCAHTNTHARA